MNKLTAMTEGGKRLGHIKFLIAPKIQSGITPREIDKLIDDLIVAGGDKPSFKMEPGYHHATCINVNSGMVHGIPNDKPFKPGDVVKVDLGLFHNGFHLDSALTIQIAPQDNKTTEFLKIGELALKNAIAQAKPGNSIYDISLAMQSTIEPAGYSVIRDLTGHGIGRELHLEPYIPCFADPHNKKNILHENQTIAIEAMYALGKPNLIEDPDGWTLSTQDGSITGMFEETIYISNQGPLILTQAN